MSTFLRGVCVLAALLAANTYGEEAPSASATVSVTVDSILALVTNEHTGPEVQQQKALAEIKRAFDFGDMSRRALATNWNEANAAQQLRFTALFTDILVNTYWRHLAHYEGQNVEIVEERVRNANSARVMTLIASQGKTKPVDYSLKLRDGRWLAYDVVIEGVSLIQNYRSSYQQLVAEDGIEGLLDRMTLKVADTQN